MNKMTNDTKANNNFQFVSVHYVERKITFFFIHNYQIYAYLSRDTVNFNQKNGNL